ncbi:MAG: DUF4111 domain-containing protein [Oscillospiraceae bacterium]|nr:DUF4111 domain-containing protein [Oscillospiraceae bacterium]
MPIISTEELLDNFVTCSEEILKDDLTGIYLHGSAVMGCFNPEKSDLDMVIVVRKPLTDLVKKEYLDMVVGLNALAPKKGIEMSIVTKAVCDPFEYPTPFELHFSIAHLDWYKNDPDDYIKKMKGTDKDLAAHFTIITNRGRCLCGEPIKDVFAVIPKDAYFDSIRNDISNATDDICSDTMYLTLNLARVLAYKKDESILSKKEGGEWALDNLPDEYHPLIRSAMKEYSQAISVVYDIELAKLYAKYMLSQIAS